MYVYELYLTTKCNRKCDFCHVPKTNYIESIENILKFCSHIKNKHLVFDNFLIILFGGEPLLNIDGVKFILKLFLEYSCDIVLCTNGDLLNACTFTSKELSKLKIQVTTYDFNHNADKYVLLLSISDNIQFAYTFTDNDLNLLLNFYDFCNRYNAKCHISYSHSIKSWNNLQDNDIYNAIYLFTRKVFNDYFADSRLLLNNCIESYFKRIILLIFNEEYTKPIICLDDNKIVYYHGKFLEKCIHLFNSIPTFENCKQCQYNKICTKTCLLSVVDNNVPKKLCYTKKAVYDAITHSIHEKLSTDRMKDILSVYCTDLFFLRV